MNTDLKRKMEDMGTTGEAQKRPRQGEDECSKCGGTGHPMSRCTSPKGANEQCHNCGGYSHMMSVCPSPKGAKLGCHICSGKGHQAKSCPNNGGQVSVEMCYICRQPGHFARFCPTQNPQFYPDYRMGMPQQRIPAQYPPAQAMHQGMPVYGAPGHDRPPTMAPYAAPGGHLGGPMHPGGGAGCYRCSQPGHIAKDCPNVSAQQIECYKCHGQGHIARDCPSNGAGAF